MNSIIKEIEVDFHWLYLVKLTIPPPTPILNPLLPYLTHCPLLSSPLPVFLWEKVGQGGGCITAGTI